MIGTIANLASYTAKMQLGMVDKLYFVDLIPHPALIVDFGCADAAMLTELRKMGYTGHYLGVDVSPDMIALAKRNFAGAPGVTFHQGDDIPALPKVDGPVVLILSSVIHEVCHYNNEYNFWSNVWARYFDYICVRDMWVPYNSGVPSAATITNVLYHTKDMDRLVEFMRHWGPINESNRILLHYLLKYKYVEHWDREMPENYFSFNPDKLLKLNVVHNKRYGLPFLHKQWKDEFGIDMVHNTHYKMIIKN